MRELPIVILATLASHPARPSILRRYPLAYGALGSKAARGPLTPVYKRNGRSIPAARASAMWKFSRHGRTALFGRSATAPRSLTATTLHFSLLSHFEGIVNLDAEVAYRAFKL